MRRQRSEVIPQQTVREDVAAADLTQEEQIFCLIEKGDVSERGELLIQIPKRRFSVAIAQRQTAGSASALLKRCHCCPVSAICGGWLEVVISLAASIFAILHPAQCWPESQVMPPF
jgi:hypothetical protein